ncbi:MAG: OmpA family protein [Desulfurivibrionaceae bacterium]
MDLPGPNGGGDRGGLLDRPSGRDAKASRYGAAVRPVELLKTSLYAGLFLAVLLFLLLPREASSAVHGDSIVNKAILESGGQPAASSSVSVTVVVRTPSEIVFLKYAPASAEAAATAVPATAYRTGGGAESSFEFLAVPLGVPASEPIDLSVAIPLAPAAIFHRGEPVFVRLFDPDQNVDFENAETVLVTLSADNTGDVEVLRLGETGPNTGVFAGYIQSSLEAGAAYDGRLEVGEAGVVEARYVDPVDNSDNSAVVTLFDPFGFTFDSATGLPVNGAVVTLVNADTGEPAVVFGDDGISRYPSTLTTGGIATDSSGSVYAFDPGAYRFPFVAPGNYRLDVLPPGGYAAPSAVADADLQLLPGAPYALETGSRNETFQLNPGPALRIDIPIDPVAAGSVWLRKTAAKKRAAAGDFVPYRVEMENPHPGLISGITLTDRLPAGFRYQAGSARLDGERFADPAISADGRTLTFNLGDLPGEESREIRYVAEVGAGASPGAAVNTAVAVAATGSVSNTATATVLVGEDFFRTTTFLMGRVFTGGCEQPEPEESEGLAGARIYLEDGTYVVSDENGMFHIEGVRPGSHVVQLDLDSLPEKYEVIACEGNSRFAGRAYSQFVDLQEGSMWRVDFHVALKPRARGEVSISLNGALEGETAEFRIPIEVGAVSLRNLRLSVILPERGRFVEGSAVLDGEPLADPVAGESGLEFRLGEGEANLISELSFRCRLDEGAPGELTSRAVLTFDTPTAKDLATPTAENLLLRELHLLREKMPDFTVRPHFPTLSAELSEQDRAELDLLAEQLRKLEIIRLYAVGHTDNVPITPRSRHLFADNFALSEARTKSVGRYLAEALSLPPGVIILEGAGASLPIADNATAAGRALNRRVEVRVQCEKVTENIELQLVKDRSGDQKTGTLGLRPGETWAEEQEKSAPAGRQTGILSPADGSVLASRIAAVRIKLDGRLKPRLLLDGAEISADRIGFTMDDKDSGLKLYSYIGIDFGGPGEHLLKIEGIGPFGNARFEESAVIIRTGEIAAIKLLESDGNIADGVTPVSLRVALLDESGKVIRTPAQLEIREGDLLPPENRKAVASEVEAVEEGNTVTVDGDGYVRFAPVQSSGSYRAVLGYGDRTLEAETYVKPVLRDWVLVGLAEGTVGYDEVSGNLENLPAGAEEDLYDDGRLAFFGKGRVLGKWLLTLAYDSDKPDRKDKELFQIIDPDAYYTLYGDASRQAYEAASAEKLYVKMERDKFYALFGDYDTGLSKTELSRYSRSLTGLKAEYNGRYAAFNLFASDTDQGFVKDEIRGDGTSGLYHFSRRDIVVNSEKVIVEVRDRLRSEVILFSRELSRHLDYNIDYADGTLFFKEPIPSRDENFNPIYIVVDYEVTGQGDGALNYGGRGALRWPEAGLEVGASAIHEQRDNIEGDLYGVDAAWEITTRTRLRAELATSDTAAPGDLRDGSAWLAELEHRSEKAAGKLYLREQASGFGLGQQKGSEEGTRKFGADGVYRLKSDLDLGGLFYRQYNLDTDAVRDVAQTDLTYKAERYSLSTGLRFAEDRFDNGVEARSTQALLGGSWQAYKRLLLRGAHEQSFFGDNQSGDFPTRTTLGAEFKLLDSTTIFAAQEFSRGDDSESRSTRAGFKATPWSGGSLGSSLEQRTGEYGPRMFALFGLNQNWQVSERWSLDGGFDRSHTVRKPDAEDFDTDVSAASGENEDFTAVSLGATLKLEKWSWANRLEYRDGDFEDKWGVLSALVGEVHRGLAVSGRTQMFATESAREEKTDGEVRLGLAYRPLYSRWIVLDRLDFLFEEVATETVAYDNWRVVNNLNANYRPNLKTQISLQYGAKYVNETIDGEDYGGYTDLSGLEGRYDLTPKWDVGLRGAVLHSWDANQYDYTSGVSVGHNLVENIWLSLGYNFTGFKDRDFSRADFTAAGPYLKMRMKFDQNSVRDAVKMIASL